MRSNLCCMFFFCELGNTIMQPCLSEWWWCCLTACRSAAIHAAWTLVQLSGGPVARPVVTHLSTLLRPFLDQLAPHELALLACCTQAVMPLESAARGRDRAGAQAAGEQLAFMHEASAKAAGHALAGRLRARDFMAFVWACGACRSASTEWLRAMEAVAAEALQGVDVPAPQPAGTAQLQTSLPAAVISTPPVLSFAPLSTPIANKHAPARGVTRAPPLLLLRPTSSSVAPGDPDPALALRRPTPRRTAEHTADAGTQPTQFSPPRDEPPKPVVAPAATSALSAQDAGALPEPRAVWRQRWVRPAGVSGGVVDVSPPETRVILVKQLRAALNARPGTARRLLWAFERLSWQLEDRVHDALLRLAGAS